MYNEEIKREFIKQYAVSDSTRRFAVVTFNTIGKAEMSLDKDICSMSVDELTEQMGKYLSTKSSGRYAQKAIIKAYCKWCVENGIEGANDNVFKYKDDFSNKIRSQTVKDFKELQEYLDVVFDDEDDASTDCTYRCYLWLAFMGIREEDALSVKTSDVNLKKGFVRVNGNEYRIYNESLLTFKICSTAHAFNYYNQRYRNSTIVRERISGNLLLRGVRGEVNSNLMRSLVYRRSKAALVDGKTEKSLSFMRAFTSGVYTRLYQLERIGVEIDFAGVARDISDSKPGNRESADASIDALARHYEEDYNAWKDAYSL